MVTSITWRKNNIRRLSSKELRTYAGDYKKGIVYKFAYDTAQAELRKRKKRRK